MPLKILRALQSIRPSRSLAGLLFLVIATRALAIYPALESVTPHGVQRGVSTVVTLRGEHLERIDDLLFLHGGVVVEGVRSLGDESVEATLLVKPDCPLGEQGFWLSGPSGLSELATLHVGRFPVLSEKEGNDSPVKAQPVKADATIEGIIDDADADCFRVDLKRGERLSAEVVAMRLGGAFLDAHLEVLDPQGRVLATSDDTALTRQDPFLSIVAKTDGGHVVRVREAAFGGDYESHYLLHIGSFSRPHIAYPAGGFPGESESLTLLGDPRGTRATKVELPFGPSGRHRHHPDDGEGGPAPTPLQLRVVDLPNVLESEPNDDTEQATPAGSGPFALNGVLQAPGDVDRFQFEAEAGDVFDIEVYGARIGSPIDSVIEVFDREGDPVIKNDDGVVHDSTLRFRAPYSGSFTLEVSDHLGRGGPNHVYRVEVALPEPKIDLSIPVLNPLKPQRGQTFAIPRGGRIARLVAARRQRSEGPIEIEASGLPSGVRFSATPIAANKHLGLMLFEADEAAPLGATLIDIQGRATTSEDVILGRLSRRIGLVFGEPRQTVYHDYAVDRTPLVVTDPAPFKLIVEPPKAPLARDGLLELEVRLQRAAGFTGAVTLDSPLLPDWVERSEDPVRIAAGGSGGLYPLIAADRVTPGDHELILTGTALVNGTQLTLASQPFSVRLIEPHAQIEIARTASEQGSEAVLPCKLNWLRPPEGEAVARLRGLPKHSSAPDVVVTAATERFEFRVTVGKETPESIHNTLYVELQRPEAGGSVRQFLGRGGTLEVVPPGGVARETISRLEILRRAAQSHAAETSSRQGPIR